MIEIRKMTFQDFPALQEAMENDSYHPGLWKTSDFEEKDSYYEVFEDARGVIVFVKYKVESHSRIRIFTVWSKFDDNHRNARAIVLGINKLVEKIRGSQFTEIVFSTENDKLSTFCTKVLKFEPEGNGEYVRKVN